MPAGLTQPDGGAEAGEPGADDEHVVVFVVVVFVVVVFVVVVFVHGWPTLPTIDR
ncbi:hypothetical protein Athai_40860 [Actinocatenispora thailandica]|uniref:Uncharacterized protein n=1 Tax=Actinocatenispora thailandica TaxID=227318 RepID=A0A7R7DRM9_9ACTN|nr:hypothetical protein Athai_40860 [Actinocatenispora thailandica]